MMATGIIKNQICSIIPHIVWDNFEFTPVQNCSFSGTIPGHDEGQNDQKKHLKLATRSAL